MENEKEITFKASDSVYDRIVIAANGEKHLQSFMLRAVMDHVNYVEGLDRKYLDEYAETERSGIKEVYSS